MENGSSLYNRFIQGVLEWTVGLGRVLFYDGPMLLELRYGA